MIDLFTLRQELSPCNIQRIIPHYFYVYIFIKYTLEEQFKTTIFHVMDYYGAQPIPFVGNAKRQVHFVSLALF